LPGFELVIGVVFFAEHVVSSFLGLA